MNRNELVCDSFSGKHKSSLFAFFRLLQEFFRPIPVNLVLQEIVNSFVITEFQNYSNTSLIAAYVLYLIL